MEVVLFMLISARYVVPITSPPLKNASVAVEGRDIVAFGPTVKLKRSFPHHEVLDLGDLILMPGLLNLHTHLDYTVFKDLIEGLAFTPWIMKLVRLGLRLKREDWEASALLGALRAIQSGTTTVVDSSRSDSSLKAISHCGLRGIVCGEVFGLNGRRSSQTVQEALARLLGWRSRANPDLIQVGISPHAPYTVSGQLYQEVSRRADEYDFPVALHLTESADEYQLIRHGGGRLARGLMALAGWSCLSWQPSGVSPVKYLEQWGILGKRVLAAHCIYVDDSDLEILHKYDVAIAHCPRSNAQLGNGIAPLTEFHQRGLRVGLGTDSLASNYSLDMFDEMRAGLLLQRGMTRQVEGLSAETFLRMATIEGARAISMEDKIGSIARGKRADLIGVDLSHIPSFSNLYAALIFNTNPGNVVFSMINGQIVMEKGQLKGIDGDEIVKRADRARRKLTKVRQDNE
ncbi:amidohydrolase family protein [Candidatus Hakubella thermalkaliphila]|nr:amidohydrolase family protein [Candidatus Hakubella thermalkaliphila]